MRRFPPAVLLAITLFAPLAVAQETTDRRSEKRQLVNELLKTIDMKQFTQSLLDVTFDTLSYGIGDTGEMPAEQRKQYEEQQKAMREKMAKFRERLYTRIDYDKIAQEQYVPYFEKTFSSDELRTLIAFYKTKEGQKMARAMPELTIGSMVKTMRLLQELSATISQEMEDEEMAKKPYSRAMSDLRSLAVAAEAYATDENHYPKASSMKELAAIVSPTYIRTVPEKDPWGGEYRYYVSSDLQHYRIVSGGNDHSIEGSSAVIESIPAKTATVLLDRDGADLIYQDGQFVQLPKDTEREH